MITISPAGQISGLQVKPGKGLDLRQFGEARIERASEIVWSVQDQLWKVHITKGRYSGEEITAAFCALVGFDRYSGGAERPVRYADYDDAVQFEIAVLDHIRITEGPDAL